MASLKYSRQREVIKSYLSATDYHALCTECERLFDLNMNVSESIIEEARACFPGTIHSHSTIFYGVCSHCQGKKY